jgi:hypothetical protein
MCLFIRNPLLILVLFCLVALISPPVPAAPASPENNVLYSTSFDQADDWSTNSNERYFLDNKTGRYHYLIEGGTGSYAAVPLPEKVSGPFVLEFDVTPDRIDEGGTFRFGIGTDKKDSMKGPLIMAELADKKDGKLFYLKAVSKGNSLQTVGSSPSTGGPGATVRYEDGRTYHIKLTYYAADNRASIVVQESGSSAVLFTAFTMVPGKVEDMNYLFLTSLGDGVPGPQAEGYLDNISLTLPKSQSAVNPTETPTPEVTNPPPTIEPIGVETTAEPTAVETITPSRTEFPSPPKATPTPKSGLSILFLVPSLGIAAFLASRRG